MKKTLLIAGLVGLFTTSCSCDKEETKDDAKKENNTEATAKVENELKSEKIAVVANDEIDLPIQGMMCGISCKGAVKKCLASIPGVANCTVNFEEEEEIDHAIVSFDNTLTSKEEMIAKVEALNQGAYKVVEEEEESHDHGDEEEVSSEE